MQKLKIVHSAIKTITLVGTLTSMSSLSYARPITIDVPDSGTFDICKVDSRISCDPQWGCEFSQSQEVYLYGESKFGARDSTENTCRKLSLWKE